ncbi:MAG: leucyl aminopeptidase [Candidatus Binatia bacterium]|nr:leucyl aminopeptidase [Candidatus Binatia bacterium]
MDIRRDKGAPERLRCDLLVVPVRSGFAKASDVAALDRATDGRLLREAKKRRHDISKRGAVFVYQTHGELPAEQIALIGVGGAVKDEPSKEVWRRLAGQGVDLARRSRCKGVAFSVAQSDAKSTAAGAIAEGVLLATHPVRNYKSGRGTSDLTSCSIVGVPATRAVTDALSRSRAIAEATGFARDLINEPAAVVTPAHLGQVAQKMKKEFGLAVRVLGKRELSRMKMGAILAVGQASVNEPRLIELVYTPPKGARGARRGPIALVGKGVTFDSGGLSLKPPGNMEIQKRDMAGAAAVLGAMRAVARLQPAVEVRGYIASAENMPGGNAYRPGDVLHTHSGRTVEVLNTDAEGRLVLADALAWAASGAGSATRPRYMVDVATLTGAVTVALGRSIAGIMGTEPALIQHLIESGRDAGEPMWELPLVDEYVPAMDSLVADMKNIGDGTAGSIFGGLFLREFVGGVPWAHLDIAAVAFADKAQPYIPRGAVGWGVRSLVGMVERIAAAR